MSEIKLIGRFGASILAAAGIVIIMAGLKLSAQIIVPFLLAAFVALLCTIPLFWLNRKGVPNVVSVLIVVVCVLSAGAALGVTVGASINKLTRSLPGYRANLSLQLSGLVSFLEESGVDLSPYRDSIDQMLDPSAAFSILASALKQTGAVVTNGLLISLTVVFILLEAVGMPEKLKLVVQNPESTFRGFEAFLKSVKQYLAIKTIVSAVTGLAAGISTAIIGVDFPVLWGLSAFAFNFVPTIGSVIAAVPPVVLALVQLGPRAAFVTGICYLVINVVMGNIVEPRLTGEGLGLSSLVVFLSLVFWGWLLGPVGMLLSVPLTMIVKIACESNPETKHIGILLGPSIPKSKAPEA